MQHTYADERNSCTLRRNVVCRCRSARDGNDELRYTHADGSHEKQTTTAHLLNKIETWQSRNDIDHVGDDLQTKVHKSAGVSEG